MTELKADNLDAQLNIDGQIVCEPGYLGFLRSQGYTIDELKELHTVPSESEKDKAHMVVKVSTFLFPADDPLLDIVEHKIDLWVCDCWSFRQNSADVTEPDVTPKMSESCKHIEQVSKVEKAKNDDNQAKLI